MQGTFKSFIALLSRFGQDRAKPRGVRFPLPGDFNVAGESDYGVVSSADYAIWQSQNGLSGAFEQFSADADDDGDVDAADYDLWSANQGHTLQLLDIGV